MANEITVTSSLSIRKISGSTVLLDVQNRPGTFRADMTGCKGPVPGAITIPTTGKLIYFDQLTTPGFCVLKNFDTANYFEWGIYDPQTNVFYPVGEVLPGMAFVILLSRNLQEQYTNSGTGTTTPENYFMVKANKASVNGSVEAYEK